MAKLTKKLFAIKKTKRTKLTYSGLRRFNFIIAGLFALQAAALLVLADSNKGIMPVITNFFTADTLASSASGSQVLVQGSSRLFDIRLAYILSAVLIISALGHFLYSTWLRKAYESRLKKNQNPTRWVLYCVSIGLLLVVVALLVGVQDISLLLAVWALVVFANITRILLEKFNRESKDIKWTNYWLSLGAGLVNFLIIGLYIWGSEFYGSRFSTYVYFVVATVLLAFIAISLVLRLNFKKPERWANYLYVERLYIILSFLAISAVTWQVFFGTLRS